MCTISLLPLGRLCYLLPPLLPSHPKQKGSKVLADAMEALLGAFVVAGGHSAALAFLQVRAAALENALLSNCHTVWSVPGGLAWMLKRFVVLSRHTFLPCSTWGC